MKIEIFRAKRGEGKTKWLFNKAVEAKRADYDLWYVGSFKTMKSLSEMWSAEFHEICPIKFVGSDYELKTYKSAYCFLTDELVENFEKVGFWNKHIMDMNGVWYITMGAEHFIN